jgi:uncharacterized protein (DUF1778 family)
VGTGYTLAEITGTVREIIFTVTPDAMSVLGRAAPIEARTVTELMLKTVGELQKR